MMGSFVIHRWGGQNSLSIQACMVKIPFDIKPWSEKQKQLIRKLSEFETEMSIRNDMKNFFLWMISKFWDLHMPTAFAKAIWNIHFVSQHSEQYVVGLDPVTQLLDFSYHNTSCSHMKQHVAVFSYKWQSFCLVIASSLPKPSKMLSVKSNLT